MADTFSQFKQKFYSRQPDLTVFDCEEYNLLKVVLDGLKVDYLKRGVRHQILFGNRTFAILLILAKRIKHGKKIREAKEKCRMVSSQLTVPYFFFDNGRVSENGKGEQISFYFNKIERYLGAENCVTIYQSKTPLKKGEIINALFLATYFDFYSSEDKAFIQQLTTTYTKITSLKIFDRDELFNIRVAINKFFDEYRFWRFMLKEAKVKFALFDEHYHREGFILALKRRKISAIELQHGLIASEDIFYVFPKEVEKIASRALFPEKIFTYGRYWSNILNKGFEFKRDQIDVLGAYQEINTNVSAELKKEMDDFVNARPFIVITTQTFLHEHFVTYILWLSADLVEQSSDVKIIVKTHPSENPAHYERLSALSNVRVVSINTEYLLSRCTWHVSCYSTTLYDATRYECTNYSLLIEACKDYIDTFVREGISLLLRKDQNPSLLEERQLATMLFDKGTLYEDFEQYKYKLRQIEII